jgi:hypothetical protein
MEDTCINHSIFSASETRPMEMPGIAIFEHGLTMWRHHAIHYRRKQARHIFAQGHVANHLHIQQITTYEKCK